MPDTQVLIVGAGPTGLVLALWLRRLGVDFRIIDKDEGPGETSRALAVQARTLEFHRQIGIADDVVAAGIKVEQITIRSLRGIAARVRFGDFGVGLSHYPYVLALPQDVHEGIMIRRLEQAGMRVERRTELTAFVDNGSRVTATLRRGDGGTETVEARWLCGADGARSTVRHLLGLGFPGGTYSQVFYVADVVGSGPAADDGLDVCLGSYGFAITMPVCQTGSLRLIGIVPKEHEADATIRFEDIRQAVERDTNVAVKSVNWFSTYHVHHRVADRFRVNRAFILGDAGHVHSPAGGQGMNTGMGDAVNLAWKLAAVLQGRADPRLLDSYEPERIAFARRLVATTDQVFRIVTARSAFGTFWRRLVMPNLAALAVRFPTVPRTLYRTVSQIDIRYRDSPLSRGVAGKVEGGDRLPYVAGVGGDNFQPLDAVDWQVHVYGVAASTLASAVARPGIPLHAFPWSAAAETAGLARDAAYLVRPDGHVAVAAAKEDPAPFERYLADWAIKPIAPAP